MSDIGGVWRTVGGRRIFIKDGEDLATAMKNSGKFTKGETDSEREKARMAKWAKEDKERDEKAKKELTEEAKELMDDIKYLDPEEEGFGEAFAEVKERFADLRRKETTWQSAQSREVEGAIKELESANDKRIFKNISKFYGYDKMSNYEIERILSDAERMRSYHSRSDIAAMRRYMASGKRKK